KAKASEAKDIIDPNDKRSVVSWIRTVFPSQEDANTFLKLQLEKLQDVQENSNENGKQQSSESTSASLQSSTAKSTIESASDSKST
ncbi:hypothetical protein B4U79_10083, partial [Dinothrombium tinctorium]